MIEKETYTDELGRKVKTVHRTQSGALDYVNEYFYDNNHLNVNGAEIYTQFFLKRLKEEEI